VRRGERGGGVGRERPEEATRGAREGAGKTGGEGQREAAGGGGGGGGSSNWRGWSGGGTRGGPVQ